MCSWRSGRPGSGIQDQSAGERDHEGHRETDDEAEEAQEQQAHESADRDLFRATTREELRAHPQRDKNKHHREETGRKPRVRSIELFQSRGGQIEGFRFWALRFGKGHQDMVRHRVESPPKVVSTLTGAVARSSVADVALLDALYAFYREHERCGDLDAAVDGDRVWMACTCVAVLVHVVAFGYTPRQPAATEVHHAVDRARSGSQPCCAGSSRGAAGARAGDRRNT